eukprot:scaffold165381_cov28-Tisochrysis_lutea.AAC.3
MIQASMWGCHRRCPSQRGVGGVRPAIGRRARGASVWTEPVAVASRSPKARCPIRKIWYKPSAGDKVVQLKAM